MQSDVWHVIRQDFSPYHGADFTAQEQSALESLPGVKYGAETMDAQSIGQIWLTNTHTKLAPLKQLTELKVPLRLVIHTNSGYDNFDAQWVQQAPFPIVVGNSIRAQAVAQYILQMLLGHFLGPTFLSAWDPTRLWPRSLLCEKNVLLIGHGHIGKILSQALKPLVRELHIYDPHQGHGTMPDLGQQHIVIPIASLNRSSEYLINTAFLQQLPEDFVLINAARGKLVQLEPLLALLNQRPKAWAYLDVFPQEPYPIEQLASYKNLKCTGHVAGVFAGLDAAIIQFEKAVVQHYLECWPLNERGFNKRYETQLLNRRLDAQGQLI